MHNNILLKKLRDKRDIFLRRFDENCILEFCFHKKAFVEQDKPYFYEPSNQFDLSHLLFIFSFIILFKDIYIQLYGTKKIDAMLTFNISIIFNASIKNFVNQILSDIEILLTK